MARSFLLKINSNVAPGGIGRPVEAAQWEGETCSPKHSTKTALPENGDKIYIWINEEPRPDLARQIEPGYGLTASANMLGEPDNSELGITQVVIIPEGVLNNEALKTTYENDSLLSAFGTSAVQPLRWRVSPWWNADNPLGMGSAATATETYLVHLDAGPPSPEPGPAGRRGATVVGRVVATANGTNLTLIAAHAPFSSSRRSRDPFQRWAPASAGVTTYQSAICQNAASAKIDDLDPVRHLSHRVLMGDRQGSRLRVDPVDGHGVRIEPDRE
jgi:hypothetical protein